MRGGTREVPEGKVRGRTVVLEFPSYDAALACYRSPEYQAAKRLRDGKGELDLIVVEGYDGPAHCASRIVMAGLVPAIHVFHAEAE